MQDLNFSGNNLFLKIATFIFQRFYIKYRAISITRGYNYLLSIVISKKLILYPDYHNNLPNIN